MKQEEQWEEEEVELQAEQLNGQADAGTLEHLGQEAALREEREGQESYDDLDSALCACHAQADVQDGEVMREESQTCGQELLSKGKWGKTKRTQQSKTKKQTQDQEEREK